MLKTSIFTFYHEKSHITISTTIPLYCTVLQYCTAHFYLAVQPGVSSSGIQQGQEELGERGRANDLSPPHGPWIHSVFHHVGLQVLSLAPGPREILLADPSKARDCSTNTFLIAKLQIKPIKNH